jgi:hypothetical protein
MIKSNIHNIYLQIFGIARLGRCKLVLPDQNGVAEVVSDGPQSQINISFPKIVGKPIYRPFDGLFPIEVAKGLAPKEKHVGKNTIYSYTGTLIGQKNFPNLCLTNKTFFWLTHCIECE